MKTVGFCVIEPRSGGLIHARNLACRIPSAELVGLCDASPQNLQEAGSELGISSLHADYRDAIARRNVDAVVIVTPTFLHREVACYAAEHGKHIFLEKPMALTVGECQEVNAAVQKAGLKLQIGFMRRFDENFKEAHDLLAGGELGRS